MFLHQDFSSQTTVHLNTYILMVRGWRTLDLDRKENCLNINTIILTFMGPCIVNISQYISNKMQRYTVYLYLETALHVSTHPRHQPAATWVNTTRYCKYSQVLLMMGENIA